MTPARAALRGRADGRHDGAVRGTAVLIMSVEQLARVLVDVERAMQIGVKRWRLRMARQFACDLVHMRRRYGWRRYFMPSWHAKVRNYRMFCR